MKKILEILFYNSYASILLLFSFVAFYLFFCFVIRLLKINVFSETIVICVFFLYFVVCLTFVVVQPLNKTSLLLHNLYLSTSDTSLVPCSGHRSYIRSMAAVQGGTHGQILLKACTVYVTPSLTNRTLYLSLAVQIRLRTILSFIQSYKIRT